jgi:peptidoglycan/xylan/chitin deacetylase (PgdA/CDA1 family)
MKKKPRRIRLTSFSQAEKLAAVALLVAIPLFGISSWMAPIPLLFFLLLCIIAPFFPQWGFFLPIISKSVTGSKAIALTFDDGPSQISTPILLDLLKQYNYKATFFVIGKKAEKHPTLMARIIEEGHSIGNHSWQHDSLLMLRSKKQLRQDIRKTQEILMKYGIHPKTFRPPAGATNPRLKNILKDENLHCITFSCRPLDYGNKKIMHLADRIMKKLHFGGIILLHDLAPQSTKQTDIWQQEITLLFSDLQKNAYKVQPLEALIGFPVMETIQPEAQ